MNAILGTLALALTLHAGPEWTLSPPVDNGSPYDQSLGEAATSGDVALLAWAEERDSLAAVRIDRDGRVLDDAPIVLATSAFTSAPRVTAGSDGWLVVWSANGTVEGKLVRPDGSTQPRIFAPGAGALDVSVAFDGTHYLLAWTHEGGSIRALRLDASARPAGSGIEIPARRSFAEVEVVAFAGRGFAVVASHYVQQGDFVEWTVEQFRLDTNANLLSSGVLDRTSTTTYIHSLRALADGAAIVATWAGGGAAAGEHVFLAREGQPLRLLPGGTRPFAIVKIGGQVHVVGVNLGDGTASVTSEDGTERPISGPRMTGAAAASFGDRALLGVVTFTNFEHDLFTTVVDAALQDVVPPARLETDPPLQERPSVARNSHGEALAAWVESGRRGGPALMGTLLDAAGRPRGEPFVVRLLAQSVATTPHAASDGTDFLVASYDIGGTSAPSSGTFLVPVRRDGTVGATTFLAPAGPDLCLAWNGTEYLLGDAITSYWTRFYREVHVRATRVARDGAPGETIVLEEGVAYFEHLSCAAGESATLFVYTAPGEIRGAVLTHGGIPSAPFRIASNATESADPLGGILRTAVAASGDTFLAASTTYQKTIRWAMVSEHGTPSPVDEALATDRTGRSVAAAPLGYGFLLAWDAGDDLRGLALDRSGRSGAEIEISATALLEGNAALTGGADVLAVYLRELGSELQPRWRVFSKTVAERTARRRSVR